MPLHGSLREAEFELNRLLFQIQPWRVARRTRSHVLIVPTDEESSIAVEPEFLARAVEAKDEANARFFRWHAVPGRSPCLLGHLSDSVVESLFFGAFRLFRDGGEVAMIMAGQYRNAVFRQVKRAFVQLI